MHVLKQGDRNTKSLAYMSFLRPVLQYGATCWHPCREGQINALDRVKTKIVQFTNHTKYFDWENLVQRRTITRLSAIFKVQSGERAWKGTYMRRVVKVFPFVYG